MVRDAGSEVVEEDKVVFAPVQEVPQQIGPDQREFDFGRFRHDEDDVARVGFGLELKSVDHGIDGVVRRGQ